MVTNNKFKRIISNHNNKNSNKQINNNRMKNKTIAMV